MKKSWIIIIVLVLLAIVTYSQFKSMYNELVTLSKKIPKEWSDVESVYQRRADLIPNLVATVKGYAAHEQETLEGVIEARSKATSVNIDANQLSSESFQQFQQAQEGLTQALSKLMVLVERYPELKANQNFLELQAQLEGTENRINVQRMKFNEVTLEYNTYIDTFPQNFLAKMFGFSEKPYFEAQQGADKAPEVQF